MTPSDDPLDDPGEGMPASPARRRLALAVGLAMLLLILGALVWFAVTNTETEDDRGRLLGSASPHAASPAPSGERAPAGTLLPMPPGAGTSAGARGFDIQEREIL